MVNQPKTILYIPWDMTATPYSSIPSGSKSVCSLFPEGLFLPTLGSFLVFTSLSISFTSAFFTVILWAPKFRWVFNYLSLKTYIFCPGQGPQIAQNSFCDADQLPFSHSPLSCPRSLPLSSSSMAHSIPLCGSRWLCFVACYLDPRAPQLSLQLLCFLWLREDCPSFLAPTSSGF